MYSSSTSNGSQTFTRFESGLPRLPPLSPLILGYPHSPELNQWHEHFSQSRMNGNPYLDFQDRPSLEVTPHIHAEDTPDHKNIVDLTGEDPTLDPSRQDQANIFLILNNFTSGGQRPITLRDMEAETASTCLKPNNAVMFPLLHDVGAYHAHARIVEVSMPTMQRGTSHRAEVMSTTEVCSKSCDALPSLPPNPSLDFVFPSFSQIFSSQDDSELRSPSWQPELTLPSSCHLTAQSAISSPSQPCPQRCSLVRRPATRRKYGAHYTSPNIPIRKCPRLNGSRTSIAASQKRATESGILRTINSPMLKSHGYRVRFEETGSQ